MAIVAVETSRTTVTMTTLPYTVAVDLDVDRIQNAAFSRSAGVSDRALIQTSQSQSLDGGGFVTSTDQATYADLGPAAVVETNYGSGGTFLFTDSFGIWNGKLFNSNGNFFGTGDPRNYINYYHTTYTPGASVGPISWTTSTNLTTDLTWLGPRSWCMPLAWHDLTNAVVLMTDELPDLSVRARVISDSGESTITKICSLPSGDLEPAFGIDFIIPDVTKNWFLTRLGGGTEFMSAWSADATTGVNLSEDALTFAASDVNTVVARFSDGNWFVTPTHFVFYTARDFWDSDLSQTVNNGIVVVRLTKDFTSYTVEFVTWGDAEAQAKLDSSGAGLNGYLTIDAAGNLYYMDLNNGTPSAVLSVLTNSLPLDVLDTMPRLSPVVALGATGGPGFKTTIAPADRGNRFKEWQRVRGTYQVSFIDKDQTLVTDLLLFFRTRNGRARPFRFKDWADYQLPDPGSGLLFSTQFVTDGSTTHFQLVKVYDDAANSPYTRQLRRPVAGTVQIYDDGAPTTDFSVDYTTGTVNLGPTTVATTDHVISASCEFDIRARFDTDNMVVSIKNFEVYEWQNVPIVELKDG